MTKKAKSPVRPVVLNIAGHDSSGMAGLTADIRVQSALGVHSAATISANTAQTNIAVNAINPVDEATFCSQLDAGLSLPIDVIKTGLMVSTEQIHALHERLQRRSIPLVCDPVLSSSSGTSFQGEDYLTALRDKLLPLVRVVTPNIEEASKICGLKIRTTDDVEAAAKMILAMGANSVIIKGGHSVQPWAQDYYLDETRSFWLSSRRIDSINTRGTGCVFASALASALALNYSEYDAAVIAKMSINQGLRLGYGTETEQGPVSVDSFPCHQIDLPCLTREASFNFSEFDFPECNQPILGLYPIVDRAEWIQRLAPSGISTIQLRVKDLEGDALEQEVKAAIKLSNKHHCRLFINDYWQLAIKHQAYGVHLGQEDLSTAGVTAIHKAGLRLGISSHCHYEVARAHSYRPSYIACGPVFPTKTKVMPWIPHGIDGLAYWRKVLNYPVVAIGGIDEQRLPRVLATGVDSVAMISAITQATAPESMALSLVQQFNSIKPLTE